MIKNSFKLCMSGYGHWIETTDTPQGTMVKIKVHSDGSENIELDCIVDTPQLLTQLQELKERCRNEEYILLQFIVHYSSFGHCYSGLAGDKDMLQIKGRLMALQGWIENSEHLATSPDEV